MFKKAEVILRKRDWVPSTKEWSSDSFEEQSWPVMEEHFRVMRREADAKGFHFLVLLFPDYGQVRHPEHPPFPQAKLAEFLEKQGIDHIEQSSAFRRQKENLFIDWLHLSPAGHRITAQEIYRYLEQKGWISNDPNSVRQCDNMAKKR